MTATVQGVRLLGDLVMMVGAWLQNGWLIALGLAIVVAAWLSGLAADARDKTSQA